MLALLLAAQNDMRWTTSPRLSLELALVRATMPETDADPSGLLTRLERLERLANLDPGAVVPTAADVARAASRRAPPTTSSPIAAIEPPAARAASRRGARPAERSDRARPRSRTSPRRSAPTTVVDGADASSEPTTQMPVPHAADAGSVDVALLRRSWQPLLDHLSANRQMILAAILESATVAELRRRDARARLPARSSKVGPQKVEGKKAGAAGRARRPVRHQARHRVRRARGRATPAGPAAVEIVEEDEVVDEAEALKRVQEMLGAQVAADAEPAE